MGQRSNTVLVPMIVMAAGIGAYHLAVHREAAPLARQEELPAPPPSSITSSTTGLASTGGGASFARSEVVEAVTASLRRMEDRLAAVENRLREGLLRPTGTDGEGVAMPAEPAPGAARPAVDDIAAFEGLMQRVEQKRLRERDEATWRRRLKNASITLPLNEEEEFVAAAAGYLEQVRGLFPGGSGGNTVEERQRQLAKMEELRVALLATMRDRSPSLKREDLEKFFPPAPTSPMERTGPGDGGAMGR